MKGRKGIEKWCTYGKRVHKTGEGWEGVTQKGREKPSKRSGLKLGEESKRGSTLGG